VRGLDYYTRTVFEFVSPGRASIGGGGRYDGLIAQVGGIATPGVGFGMGLERLIALLEEQKLLPDLASHPAIYIGHMGAEGFARSHALVNQLRTAGIFAEGDLLGRSIKAQMKYADKINARHCLIIGESELATGRAGLKTMATGTTTEVSLSELEVALSKLI
jgi:histidyl-tRNA synthetase